MIARSAALLLVVAGSITGAQLPTITPEQARSDFDLLHRALAEAHGGYDRFAPRADIDRRFAAYRARLDKPMMSRELAGIVSEAMAELRDGHARLELDSATMRAFGTAHIFPLRLVDDGGRLFVLSNDTPSDSTIKPGIELLRINGRTIADILAVLRPKISGDGFIEIGKQRRLAEGFALQYWLFVDQSNRYAIEARGADGRLVTATLDGVIPASRRTNNNPINAAMVAALARVDTTSGNIAMDVAKGVHRLRIRTFQGETFLAQLDSVFRLLRSRNADKLMLDLRANGGGADDFGAKLVSYFTDKPFRYFDHIRVTTVAPSFATWLPRTSERLKSGTQADPSVGGYRVLPILHPGVGEQQPAANGFRGRLVVLTDAGSFSTTADVAAQLRSLGRATFVGEETGGGYEGNTSGLNADVVLPASKLKVRVMMYGYWNAVKPAASPGRGTIPDHVVARHIADMLAGRDPVLERAIALLR